MAEFAPAIANTELWEGGYSNNPADSGGETYRGISRNNWPLWEGWGSIDSDKMSPFFPRCLDQDSSLQGMVVDFYKKNFWQYDGLEDQAAANKIFDLAVNVGTYHAIKIVQNALNIAPCDGVYGPRTEACVNATCNESDCLGLIRMAAENYHKQIVATHPQDAIFLKGWLRRDDS